MPNIIEQQQDLEYFSDNQLLKEASQPSGTYPGYLVVAEITRRQGVRDRYGAMQTAQQGQQPTVAEQAVSEYSEGIVSADPNFQGPPQPSVMRAAQGGRIPRYQLGGSINPVTQSPYTLQDVQLMQKELGDNRDPSTLTQSDIDHIAMMYNRGGYRDFPSPGSISNWAKQTRSANPFAGDSAGNEILAYRETWSDLPGLGDPVMLHDPEIRSKYEELNEDIPAFMRWAYETEDDPLAARVRDYIRREGNVPEGMEKVPISMRSNVAAQQAKTALEELEEDKEKVPSVNQPTPGGLADLKAKRTEAKEILAEYGVNPLTAEEIEKRKATGEEFLQAERDRLSNLRSGIADLEPVKMDENTKLEMRRQLDKAIRESEDGSDYQNQLKEQLNALENDENRAAYAKSLNEGIASLNTRDKNLVDELKNLRVGDEEMTRNIRSMGYGALGAAILNIGIDNEKASAALSDGIVDIRKYRRGVKMDNVELAGKLNALDRERARDERELRSALVEHDRETISQKLQLSKEMQSESDRVESRVTNISEQIMRVNNLEQEAERGQLVATSEIESQQNNLKVQELEMQKALMDLNMQWGTTILNTAINLMKLEQDAAAALIDAERGDIVRLGHMVDAINSALREGADPSKTAGLLRNLERTIQRLSELGTGMGANPLGGTGTTAVGAATLSGT